LGGGSEGCGEVIYVVGKSKKRRVPFAEARQEPGVGGQKICRKCLSKKEEPLGVSPGEWVATGERGQSDREEIATCGAKGRTETAG